MNYDAFRKLAEAALKSKSVRYGAPAAVGAGALAPTEEAEAKVPRSLLKTLSEVPSGSRRAAATKLFESPPLQPPDFSGYNLFDYSKLGKHHVGVPQRDLPRKQGQKIKGGGVKNTERMERLLADPFVEEGLYQAIRRGQGFRNWYDVSPFNQAFLDANPDPEALDRFYNYQTISSARNPVPNQLKTGSYLWTLGEQGLLGPGSKVALPKGYGGLAQKGIVDSAKKFAETGKLDPLEYPKRSSYIANWQGNLQPGTMDTHAVRLPGMFSDDPQWLLREVYKETPGAEKIKVSPRGMVQSGEMTLEEAMNIPGMWEAAPAGSEYGAMEALWRKAGKRAGMKTAQAQASGWVGGGPLTGLKSAPKVFLQALEDRIKATAAERNMTPAQVIRDLALAKPGSYLRAGAPVGLAAGAAGTLAPTDEAEAGIAGTLAKTANLDMLKVAMKAEETGLPAAKIYDATGWARGADGKWRWEFDDSAAKLGNDAMDLQMYQLKGAKSIPDKLGNTLKNPEAYAAYPDLKGVPVTHNLAGLTRGGSYSPPKDSMTLDASTLGHATGSIKPVIGHETQHAIQKREGFSRGGDPEYTYDEKVKRKNEIEKELDALYVKMLDAHGKDPQEYDKLAEKSAAQRKLLDESGLWSKAQIREDAFNEYRKLAGEVEARNVEGRMGMTPDDRRMRPFFETEDVPREQQIVRGALAGGAAVGAGAAAGEAQAAPAPGITAMARRYQADQAKKQAKKQAQPWQDELRTHQPLAPAGGAVREAAMELANPINWASAAARKLPAVAAIEGMIYPRELGMGDLYDPRTGEPRPPQLSDEEAKYNEQTAELMRQIEARMRGERAAQ